MKAVVNQSVEFKKYVGVANFLVKKFNPDTNAKGEPLVYFRADNEGTEVLDLKFYLECAAPKFSTIATFTIKNKPFTNKDVTKVKVIDNYGATCWMTREQYENRELPVYSNGKSPRIDVTTMRPCLMGEEEFIKFARVFFNTKDTRKYDFDTRQFVELPYDDEMECFFNWNDIFATKKVDAIRQFVEYVLGQNQVCMMVGVRTTEKGQFQTVYTGYTDRPKRKITEKSFTMFQREISSMIDYAQATGRAMDTEWLADGIKEYVFEPTELNNAADADTVMDAAAEANAAPAENPAEVFDPLAAPTAAPVNNDPFAAPAADAATPAGVDPVTGLPF